MTLLKSKLLSRFGLHANFTDNHSAKSILSNISPKHSFMCVIVSFLCVWRSLLIFSFSFYVNCFSNTSTFLSFFIFSRHWECSIIVTLLTVTRKALEIYFSFIFFSVILICVAYLFSITLINHFWLYNVFMKLCGDVEESQGPKPNSNQNFSICHWNLKIISAHNYIKPSLLRAYLSTHKFGVICISENYLDSDSPI